MDRTSLLFAVFSVQAASLAAQQIPVTLSASLPSESGKLLPVIGRFWFVFEGGRDSVTALTDGAGRARVNLPLGNYRLRSHQRVTLGGRSYYWDLPVSVRTNMLVELSQANSQDAPPAVTAGALVMDAPEAAQAKGQQPTPVTTAPPVQTRHGLWVGLGFGYGSLGCEGCGSRTGALSGTFRIGGAISPTVGLGVSTNGWFKSEGGASVSMGNVSFVLTAYSSATSGFHLMLGGGLSVLGADVSGFGSDSEVGPGGLIGFGYDAMVARSFALTPYINLVGGSFNGSMVHFVQVGIAATWP